METNRQTMSPNSGLQGELLKSYRRAFAFWAVGAQPYAARSRVQTHKRRDAADALAWPKYCQRRGDRISAKYNSGGMGKSIYLLAMLGLFAACEQKTTTVNPPADKKESNTTIVNPPSEKKESNTTVVNPPVGSSTTTKEEKSDINVNTSPNP